MQLLVVDAFTDVPFAGNPAAVCVLPSDAAPPDQWLLAVAAEMQHSETAFVRRRGDDWDLRWCTPAVEVDLCGHATLATAHVLWSEGIVTPTADLRFHTRSGVLAARRGAGRIELDFPALASEPVDAPTGLADALGVTPRAVARNVHDLLVELPDADAVRTLAPDSAAIAALDALDARAVVVTAPSDDPAFDFVSRCFAPRVGIDEDPVTGSAHCALAPYWAARTGRTELVGRQVSARGGTVHCALRDDRVLLSGTAVTISRGTLLV